MARHRRLEGLMEPALTRVARAKVLRGHLPSDGELNERARALRVELRDSVLPFWLGTIDREQGGFLLGEDLVAGRTVVTEKHLVTHGRLLWVFSHAALHLGPDRRADYLEVAGHGYRYLSQRLRDAGNGGYFWSTTVAGQPAERKKVLYGQGLAIFALVEFSRASGRAEPLAEALALFRLLEGVAWDGEHGGWTEEFEHDFGPLAAPPDKNAGIHLHVVEPLAELHAECPLEQTRAALANSVAIMRERFYRPGGGRYETFSNDWRTNRRVGRSFGHEVEFGPILLRATAALGEAPPWRWFEELVGDAIERGYDWRMGGLDGRSRLSGSRGKRPKSWWVQAELMAALTSLCDAPHGAENARRLLWRQLDFVARRFAQPPSRVWTSFVGRDGRAIDTRLAHSWKAGYHEVRALVQFINRFDPPA